MNYFLLVAKKPQLAYETLNTQNVFTGCVSPSLCLNYDNSNVNINILKST